MRLLLTSKGAPLFIGLNLVDVALTALVLSWGGRELNLIYSSLGSTNLIAVAKLTLVSLVLLGLAISHQLHLLKWMNMGMGLIVAWNLVAAVTWLP